MSNVPVILVGSGLGTLGAIRLLHRAGVDAYCFGQPGIEARSRWYRPVPGLAPGRAVVEELASYLAGPAIGSAVLIACSDAAARVIAGLPAELAARFPASTSSLSAFEQVCDKGNFGALLERMDLPRPITHKIDRLEQLDEIPDAAFTGAFLKPRDSQRFCCQFGLKAIHVDSRAEATAKLAAPLENNHAMVLQQYIPGPASNHYLIDGFIDRHGSIRSMFARQRMRMYPLDFGNSSYMRSIPLAALPEAADALAKVLAEVGYRGIFSGEFKLDPRDGRYKMLEINTRVWWFVEFTGRCGVDVCTMAYRDALGLDVARVESYAVGARFVHPYFDYFACRALARSGQQSLAGGLASWTGAQQPHFNWRDAAPAVADLLDHLPKRPTKPITSLAPR